MTHIIVNLPKACKKIREKLEDKLGNKEDPLTIHSDHINLVENHYYVNVKDVTLKTKGRSKSSLHKYPVQGYFHKFSGKTETDHKIYGTSRVIVI